MSAVQALAPLDVAGNHAKPAPQQIVIGAALGHIVSNCIQTAIKLEVFEQIAKGTHQVSQLAAIRGHSRI